MKQIIQAEELAQFIFAYLLTLYLGYDWWLFWALILVPDLSMIGYAVNTKIGALTYNLGHHKGIALAIILLSYALSLPEYWTFVGILLYGHSSMDRVFGYGLKYNDNFKHTHLGMIGKEE